jgi:hypothetical protein
MYSTTNNQFQELLPLHHMFLVDFVLIFVEVLLGNDLLYPKRQNMAFLGFDFYEVKRF